MGMQKMCQMVYSVLFRTNGIIGNWFDNALMLSLK